MSLFSDIAILLDTEPRDGPGQMAIDEALLEMADRPTWRVFCWREPSVSFGYSQSLAEARRQSGGRPLVRRWTGGGVVVHDGDWTFALIVPAGERFEQLRPSESYRLLHAAIGEEIAALGSPARLAGAEDEIRGPACFTAPACGDLLDNRGAKVCGGAQRRTKRGVLHQGSLQGLAIPADFADRLGARLARRTQVDPIGPAVVARAAELAAARYATTAWLERIP